jgi:hypothetical protein
MAPFLFLAVPGHGQNLILNGSFESPVVPTGSILGIGVIPGSEVFTSPSTGINSWTVSTGSVSLLDNGGTVVDALGLLTPQSGNQFLILNSLSISALGVLSVGATGAISQAVTTTPGAAYQVSFYYAGLGVGVLGSSAEIQVGVTNSQGSTAPGNNGLVNVTLNSWTNETFNFVATGTSSTITFSEPNGSLVNANGVGLDNVSVTSLGFVAVPEYSNFATSSVGFLLLLVTGRMLKTLRTKISAEPPLAAA